MEAIPSNVKLAAEALPIANAARRVTRVNESDGLASIISDYPVYPGLASAASTAVIGNPSVFRIAWTFCLNHSYRILTSVSMQKVLTPMSKYRQGVRSACLASVRWSHQRYGNLTRADMRH